MSIISPLFAKEFTKNAIYIAILSIRIVVCSLFPTKKYQPTQLRRLVSKRMGQILRDLCALFFLFFAGHFGEMPLRLLDHHADTLNGLMAIPNLIALVALSGVVVKETKRHFSELPSKK